MADNFRSKGVRAVFGAGRIACILPGDTVVDRDPMHIPPDESEIMPEENAGEERRASRRAFLTKTARKLAYVAPVALLFKPKQAVAASQGGSLITP